MQLTPLLTVHITAALAALCLGPVAIWARRGRMVRPQLHRAFGYAWVTVIAITALSAIFIRAYQLPNIAGYSPIHLLIPLTFYSLYKAFQYLAQGNFMGHRKAMQSLYINTCLIAGVFTLLPNRYLGGILWSYLR